MSENDNNNNENNDNLAVPAPSQFLTSMRSMFDPKQGFWSSQRMQRKARFNSNLKHYDSNYVKQTFDRYISQQRHSPIIRRKNLHKKVNLSTIGHLQADIADFTSINPNSEYRYCLFFIDVFSRFAFAFPLKTRQHTIPNPSPVPTQYNPKPAKYFYPMAEALQDLIAEWEDLTKTTQIDALDKDNEDYFDTDNPQQIPSNDWSKQIKFISHDRELFVTLKEREILQQYNIDHLSPQPNDKHGMVSLVERLIGTVRRMLGRWITHTQRNDWHTVIHDLIKNYNNTTHNSLRTSPLWAVTHNDKFPRLNKHEQKEFLKWKRDPQNYTFEIDRPDFQTQIFQVGDFVRIYLKRDQFHNKAHLPNWSKEIYTIHAKQGNRYIVSLDGIIKQRRTQRNRYEPILFASYQLKLVKRPNDVIIKTERPDDDIWNIMESNNKKRNSSENRFILPPPPTSSNNNNNNDNSNDNNNDNSDNLSENQFILDNNNLNDILSDNTSENQFILPPPPSLSDSNSENQVIMPLAPRTRRQTQIFSPTTFVAVDRQRQIERRENPSGIIPDMGNLLPFTDSDISSDHGFSSAMSALTSHSPSLSPFDMPAASVSQAMNVNNVLGYSTEINFTASEQYPVWSNRAKKRRPKKRKKKKTKRAAKKTKQAPKKVRRVPIIRHDPTFLPAAMRTAVQGPTRPIPHPHIVRTPAVLAAMARQREKAEKKRKKK